MYTLHQSFEQGSLKNRGLTNCEMAKYEAADSVSRCRQRARVLVSDELR